MGERLTNQCSAFARWHLRGEKVEGTFARFALPIIWDFADVNPLGRTSGGYVSARDWVSLVVDHLLRAEAESPQAVCICPSAIRPFCDNNFDLVVTDPPYYDAIPYSAPIGYFYILLRTTLHG